MNKHLFETLTSSNRRLRKPVPILIAWLVFSSFTLAQTFTPTGSLNAGRNGHRAIALKNGMVLIAGGYDFNENALSSCELYDPLTGTFATTGGLNLARRNFGIALLDNGTVLVSGGYDANFNALASAEIYDPSTGVFALTENLNIARADATATRLSDGTVLIAGGFDTSNNALSSAELYVPSAGNFVLTGTLNTARGFATATALMDGTALMAGGWNPSGALASAELYDPAAGSFAPVGSMNQVRVRHTATLLNGGNVLITGGEDSTSNALSSAEIYSPAVGKFTLTGSMNTARGDHAVTLLTNGTVLVDGGFSCDPSNCVATAVDMSASAEIYDPISGSFGVAGNLSTARQVHTSTLLSNGMVLIAGGFTDGNPGLASAELYQPATFTPANLASITVTPVNPSLLVGGVQALVAIGILSDDSGVQLASAIWSTSDTTVATVTNDSGSNSGMTNDSTNSGVVLGVAPGTAILTACAGTICGSTTVSVGTPGGSQSFSLSGSPPSLTVESGGTATFSIMLNSKNGFNQTVRLSCGSVPSGARCTISPSSLALTAGGTATAILTIATVGPTAMSNPNPTERISWAQMDGSSLSLRITALATLLPVGLGFLSPHKRRIFGLGLITMLLLALVACGGPSSLGTGAVHTPPGSYTIVVTANSGALSSGAQLNLVVK